MTNSLRLSTIEQKRLSNCVAQTVIHMQRKLPYTRSNAYIYTKLLSGLDFRLNNPAPLAVPEVEKNNYSACALTIQSLGSGSEIRICPR